MKRLLIRASFDPYRYDKATDYLLTAHAGMNSGNLMFAYGVMNVLTTEDTVIDSTYKHSFTEQDAVEINEKYDAFILPMADAFRDEFVNSLKEYTKLIRQLKIPVIVIGIGLRAKLGEDPLLPHSFDQVAYEFVKEVLEHSALIGLRGRNTAKFLEKFGFKEGRDLVPIGCPSLYTYGASIHTRALQNLNSLVINTNTLAPRNVSDFIIRSANKSDKFYLVQQKYYEMRDILVGNHTFLGRQTVENVFDSETFLYLNKEDRIRYFFNVPEWIDFMEDKSLFLGNRFHGTVAAILGGIPHVMIPIDARTKELADFHHITSLNPSDLEGDKTIFDYFEKLDFKSFEKNHKQNFLNYLDFLNKNGLSHIFSKSSEVKRGESLMERNCFNNCPEILHPILSLSNAERWKRIIKTDFLIGKAAIKKYLKRS